MEKKTAEEFWDAKRILFPVPGASKFNAGLGKRDLVIAAIEEYSNQQLSEFKTKLKKLYQERLDKISEEQKTCTPGYDAFNILNGHRYELIHLMKLIDSL